MPINIDDFLSNFLMGAPFQSSKGSSMDTISQRRTLWRERNNPFFHDSANPISFFHLVRFIAFSWCKCTNSFQVCSLSNPIATCHNFLLSTLGGWKFFHPLFVKFTYSMEIYLCIVLLHLASSILFWKLLIGVWHVQITFLTLMHLFRCAGSFFWY